MATKITEFKNEKSKESMLTPEVKKHIKRFWWFYIILIVLLILPVIAFCDKIQGQQIGQYGDFVGGFVGTLISLITLIVIYVSFKQVNEQSIHSTIALLLQSYQHTVEDFDFNYKHGREAIKESLTLYKKGTKENYISEVFPTHIPAIIVSILYTISDSDYNKKEKLYRQIKTMLSFEERQLLLLYLLELLESNNPNDNDQDFKNDRRILKLAIFENGKKSKALKGFEEIYTKIYEDGN